MRPVVQAFDSGRSWSAFYDCTALEYFQLPASVSKIGNYVLHNAFSFALIGYAGLTAEKYYERELKTVKAYGEM